MPLQMLKKEDTKPLTNIKNIIAIAAGKGGVGKSTVAVNLTLALQALGYKVGIMDTDVYGPSVRKMLPEDRLPVQKGQQIFPASSHGIQMISMAYFCKEGQASAVRAPIANGIISQFVNNVIWDELDFLIIDFPPGTGDIQLTLSQQAHLTGAIMVTTPQEVALLDVRKAMHLFEQVRVPIIGIIENMSYYKNLKTGEVLHLFGQGGGDRLAKEKGVCLLGMIPIIPEISSSCDSGLNIFKKEEFATIAKVFVDLANRIISQISCKQTDQSLQNFELIWKEMPYGSAANHPKG